MDYRKLGQELVRALRGKRSQAGLSRRLGFKTNVLYTWESGRCSPPIAEFLRFAAKVGVSLEQSVSDFYRARPQWWSPQCTEPRTLAFLLLTDQRRQVPLVQLARATGFSRFALRRWFADEAEPRLFEFLEVLDVCSRRLMDFLATLVDPHSLSSASDTWRVLSLARHAAYQLPWSHAVMRVLETADYKSLAAHEPGWIARRLSISEAEEAECLDLLSQSRQISLDQAHWRPIEERAVDLRAGHAAARALSAWWVNTAAERAATAPGMFAYNVCGVAERDLDRIQALQLDFLKQVRAIVAESEPVERVALVAVQIFALDSAPR